MKVLRSSCDIFKGRENLIITYYLSYPVQTHQLTCIDFTLTLLPFCIINRPCNSISFTSISSMKYILKISSKFIITTFSRVLLEFLFLLKWSLQDEWSLENASASQLGPEVKETRLWPSSGALLTMILKDTFGLSTICTRVGKGKDDFFSSHSLSLLFPSISSTFSLVTNVGILAFFLVTSFHDSGLLKSSRSLSI